MRICQSAKLTCVSCNFRGDGVVYFDRPVTCPNCSSPAQEVTNTRYDDAPGIATDGIPGGLEIRHGLVNEDGSPRTFYSKTDIRRAANEEGLTWMNDTPKPYNVPWSGKVRQPEKVESLLKKPSEEA